MKSLPRGTCIIINNTFDNTYNERAGTKHDKESLIQLFKWLSFDIIVKEDLTAYEMKEFLGKIDENIEYLLDCFVCCILSHGSALEIYGNDDKPVNRSDLKKYVSSEQCPKLKGKPKLFFIQACRGKKDLEVFRDNQEEIVIPRHQHEVREENIYIAESTIEGLLFFTSLIQLRVNLPFTF